MKLVVVIPFDWKGKSYAVGDEITGPKTVDAIRAAKGACVRAVAK